MRGRGALALAVVDRAVEGRLEAAAEVEPSVPSSSSSDSTPSTARPATRRSIGRRSTSGCGPGPARWRCRGSRPPLRRTRAIISSSTPLRIAALEELATPRRERGVGAGGHAPAPRSQARARASARGERIVADDAADGARELAGERQGVARSASQRRRGGRSSSRSRVSSWVGSRKCASKKRPTLRAARAWFDGSSAVCGMGRPSGRRNSASTANQSASPPIIPASAIARISRDAPGRRRRGWWRRRRRRARRGRRSRAAGRGRTGGGSEVLRARRERPA